MSKFHYVVKQIEKIKRDESWEWVSGYYILATKSIIKRIKMLEFIYF